MLVLDTKKHFPRNSTAYPSRLYRSLAKESNMQIRKAVSANLRYMIQRNYSKTEAIRIFKEFCSDPNDLVRFHCVDSLISLCQVIPAQVISL